MQQLIKLVDVAVGFETCPFCMLEKDPTKQVFENDEDMQTFFADCKMQDYRMQDEITYDWFWFCSKHGSDLNSEKFHNFLPVKLFEIKGYTKFGTVLSENFYRSFNPKHPIPVEYQVFVFDMEYEKILHDISEPFRKFTHRYEAKQWIAQELAKRSTEKVRTIKKPDWEFDGFLNGGLIYHTTDEYRAFALLYKQL